MLPVLPSYSGLGFLKSMKPMAYGLNAYSHSQEEASVLYLVIFFSHGVRPTTVFSYLSVFIPVPSCQWEMRMLMASCSTHKGKEEG